MGEKGERRKEKIKWERVEDEMITYNSKNTQQEVNFSKEWVLE